MPNPYIGITGFMDRTEVEQCLAYVPTDSERKLMVGVLVSSMTITGRGNSLWNQFPKPRDLRKIFIKNPRAFNCLHFATREPDRLYDHLMLCLEFADDSVDGIQLNIPWPDEKAIDRVRTQFSGLKIILQLSPHLEEFARYHPRNLADDLLAAYAGCADYFLLDFSRGLGQELQPAQTYQYLIELLLEIKAHEVDIGLVVGGGLEADNVERLIGALLNNFPDLSWDTEGRMRDDAEGGGRMILDKAMTYLKKSYELTA